MNNAPLGRSVFPTDRPTRVCAASWHDSQLTCRAPACAPVFFRSFFPMSANFAFRTDPRLEVIVPTLLKGCYLGQLQPLRGPPIWFEVRVYCLKKPKQNQRPSCPALREVEVECARGPSPTTPFSKNKVDLSAALPTTLGRG